MPRGSPHAPPLSKARTPRRRLGGVEYPPIAERLDVKVGYRQPGSHGGLEQRAFVCHHLEFDRAARMLGGQRLCCIGSPVEGGRERLEVGKMIRVKSFDLDKDRLDQFVPGEGAPRSEAVAV